MKEKIKKILAFILNPRLLLCLGLAWMITNGWSYIAAFVGAWLNIPWLAAAGAAWLAILWIPITPEKILTVAIAIGLLRWLFPKDEKTLLVLHDLYEKAKSALKRREKRKHK